MPTQTKSNEDKAFRGSKPGNDLKAGTPAKPSGLSARASVEWDRLMGELKEAGILVTVAHRAPMTLAATIAADISSDWETIQKHGPYEANQKTGTTQAHPAVKRMDALRRDYIKVLGMLGLRAAVSGHKPGAADDLESILAG